MTHTAHGVERVTHWLDERGVDYELMTHPQTFTAAAEARVAGVPAGHVAKTLAIHERGSYRLVVIPALPAPRPVRLRELGGGSPHLRLAASTRWNATSPTSRSVRCRPSARCCPPPR